MGTLVPSGSGGSLILGAQYIESRFYLLMAQILGAKMCTLSTQVQRPRDSMIWGLSKRQISLGMKDWCNPNIFWVPKKPRSLKSPKFWCWGREQLLLNFLEQFGDRESQNFGEFLGFIPRINQILGLRAGLAIVKLLGMVLGWGQSKYQKFYEGKSTKNI